MKILSFLWKSRFWTWWHRYALEPMRCPRCGGIDLEHKPSLLYSGCRACGWYDYGFPL